MTSVFALIGKAENRAMTFELPFPNKEEPKLFITVRRMPEEFRNSAHYLADGDVRSRAITPDNENYGVHFITRFWYEIAGFLKEHGVSWRAADGSPLKEKFSKIMFETWIKDLDIAQRQGLGKAYEDAIAEDEKKTTLGANTAPDSSTPSGDASSTS